MMPAEIEQRFHELWERNRLRWLGIARAYALPADRDDLLQEILMQVFRSLHRFEERASIDTWAYRVALNTALGWRRASHASRARGIREPSNNLADAADHRGPASERVLRDFLQVLSPTDRAVMLLYLDDVPPSEAAQILGISAGALRVRMHRLRQQFAGLYCDEGDTP